MKLLVTLGNPGNKYKMTRHNIGFMFADRIAEKYSLSFSLNSKFDAEIAKANISDTDVLIAKPQTFMNLSGQAVRKIMNFYKIENLKKDLVKGHFGIMEPREGLEKFEGDIPVFLVPGVKFNWDGSRQGHGKGYYDRFLAKYPNAFKAGIMTPAQLSKEPLEQKETDVKMHTVIACREKY